MNKRMSRAIVFITGFFFLGVLPHAGAAAFSRTLEALKEDQNKNSVIMLTTDSDYYKYLKEATPSIAGMPTAQRSGTEP